MSRQDVVEQYISSPFDPDCYYDFLEEVFFVEDFLGDDIVPESMHKDLVYHIATLELEDKKVRLIILKVDSLDARAHQRDLFVRYAKDAVEPIHAVVAAIIADDLESHRLSLVTFEADENSLKPIPSSYKRFSYRLGPDEVSRTTRQRLKEELLKPNITLSGLKDIFSVEKVSREFFEKYHDLYTEISEYLKPQMAYFGDEKNINFFTKKLLGRIVFLYFLQKKGWLGSQREWGDGDRRFLSRCFDEREYEDFYFEILRPIFFEALNTDRRDEDDYFERLDCRMPFLNGGLFSKDTFDEQAIIIGNEIFQSIFAVLDQYNFTIIEDSPLESEVAIDPEMLGRVFESLLDDRKDKGAFYTPREIVHYMSRNALEHYLKTEAGKYNYLFTPEEFLHKTSLSDEEVLAFYEEHPVKFIEIEDYFEHLRPYRNLVIDFYIVAKLRGMLLLSNGKRAIQKKGRPEITTEVWQKILSKEYEVVAINFGTNKEIKLTQKSYKYPTFLKYIRIEEKFFALAFMPNIWGDLEMTTIFPIRERNIINRLKKFDKPLQEITQENFAFDHGVYRRVEALREDCRPLHAEPLQSGAELPRQAVVQKGLSTFHKAFTLSSLSDGHLKSHLKDRDYYRKTINKLLNESTLTQYKLKDIMLNRLKQIKVLDPAIGSGAFPMGVLHELVDLRRHLGDTTDLAQLKKEIIENAIYGIDIEPSAVEIAKLRFWLSIVVDEDTPTPLPNLFYKIMVGNSLIEKVAVNNPFDPLDIKQDNLFGDQYKINTLQDKFHEYYKEWDNDKKGEIQNEIDEIIDEVLDSKLEKHQDEIDSYLRNADIFSFDKKTANAIAKAYEDMNLIAKVKEKPTTELFFYKLYFAEVMNDGGFDVVIGNPPYVQLQTAINSSEKLADLYKDLGYKTFERSGDIYALFYEKGIELLRDRGTLCYITSNKWMKTAYGKSLRGLLAHYNVNKLIDLGPDIFESATVETNILILEKTEPQNPYIPAKALKTKRDIQRLDDEEYLHLDHPSEDAWIILSPVEASIKKKIDAFGKPLREWDLKINFGIKTGYNTAFIIDGKTKDELTASDPASAAIIKPLLRGKDIDKYAYTFADKCLIGTFPVLNLDIEEYPAIKNHLEKFLPKLKQTGEEYIDENGNKQKCRKQTGNKWYETQDPIAYRDEFEKEKIVWKRIGSKIRFGYSDKGEYCLDSTVIATGEYIKYLTALLNSKLIVRELMLNAPKTGTGDVIISVQALTPLKIHYPDKQTAKPFEDVVDQIIEHKKHGKPTKELEERIDQMVYKLYGLTQEEIKAVENDL